MHKHLYLQSGKLLQLKQKSSSKTGIKAVRDFQKAKKNDPQMGLGNTSVVRQPSIPSNNSPWTPWMLSSSKISHLYTQQKQITEKYICISYPQQYRQQQRKTHEFCIPVLRAHLTPSDLCVCVRSWAQPPMVLMKSFIKWSFSDEREAEKTSPGSSAAPSGNFQAQQEGPRAQGESGEQDTPSLNSLPRVFLHGPCSLLTPSTQSWILKSQANSKVESK